MAIAVAAGRSSTDSSGTDGFDGATDAEGPALGAAVTLAAGVAVAVGGAGVCASCSAAPCSPGVVAAGARDWENIAIIRTIPSAAPPAANSATRLRVANLEPVAAGGADDPLASSVTGADGAGAGNGAGNGAGTSAASDGAGDGASSGAS